MLILKRKANQFIDIGKKISICVLGFDEDQVSIGIDAPKYVAINRREINEIIRRRAHKKTRQRQKKTILLN